MRATMVPSSMAVSATGSHFVVTAVNSCPSIQLYKQKVLNEQKKGIVKFNVGALMAEDWTEMLRMCRALSHPAASYTFCSPGDTSIVESEAEDSTKNIINDAFVHVVERTQGDFVPNNEIYHQLQKYKLNTATVSASDGRPEKKKVKELIVDTLRQIGLYKDKTSANTGEDSANTSRDTSSDGSSNPPTVGGMPPPKKKKKKDAKLKFAPFLQAAQALPPVAVGDLVKEGITPEDGFANISEQEKAARDPLNHNYEALKLSEENMSIDPNSDKEDLFYFYPHKVNVQDQIPFRSKHFCVLVNLMPIVPLHMLVVPIRCVGTIHALQEEELEDWGRVVRRTVEVLDRLTPYDSNYSIAIQQGGLAGQTVPHLHTHIIPFDPAGSLAGEPETEANRVPRSAEEMRKETELLKEAFRNIN